MDLDPNKDWDSGDLRRIEYLKELMTDLKNEGFSQADYTKFILPAFYVITLESIRLSKFHDYISFKLYRKYNGKLPLPRLNDIHFQSSHTHMVDFDCMYLDDSMSADIAKNREAFLGELQERGIIY